MLPATAAYGDDYCDADVDADADAAVVVADDDGDDDDDDHVVVNTFLFVKLSRHSF